MCLNTLMKIRDREEFQKEMTGIFKKLFRVRINPIVKQEHNNGIVGYYSFFWDATLTHSLIELSDDNTTIRSDTGNELLGAIANVPVSV